MNSYKILALGYIPKSKGGKQLTGLATGIFDLHNTVNLKENLKISIVATDIHKKIIKIENTEVIGWTPKILLLYILQHPIRSLLLLLKSIKLLQYRKIISYFPSIFKLILFDYAVNYVKPDYLHFHGTYGALLSSCLLDYQKKKILRLHGLNGYDNTIKHFKLHNKAESHITKLNFDYVTFVSTVILNDWQHYYGRFNCPMVSILNGFDPGTFKYNEETSNVRLPNFDLISIGGFSDRKGQRRIIEALLLLKKENISLSYINIGHISEKDKISIEELVNKFDLHIQIIDFINQKDLLQFICNSKYFILPSMSEGFGKVYIESIACGIPVIVPKQLPIAQENNLLNTDNSILIEDSSVQAIYDGLRAIVSNNINFDKKKVAKSVEELAWSTIAEKYSKIYQMLDEKL